MDDPDEMDDDDVKDDDNEDPDFDNPGIQIGHNLRAGPTEPLGSQLITFKIQRLY